MSSQNKKSYYLLIPVLLVLMALAIYLVFRLPGGEAPHPNVLFITMDSLRHDHLGCTGYEKAHTPHIDALAQDGAGLGTMWGEETAASTLREAGFTRVAVECLPHDIQNCYYVVTKG